MWWNWSNLVDSTGGHSRILSISKFPRRLPNNLGLPKTRCPRVAQILRLHLPKIQDHRAQKELIVGADGL